MSPTGTTTCSLKKTSRQQTKTSAECACNHTVQPIPMPWVQRATGQKQGPPPPPRHLIQNSRSMGPLRPGGLCVVTNSALWKTCSDILEDLLLEMCNSFTLWKTCSSKCVAVLHFGRFAFQIYNNSTLWKTCFSKCWDSIFWKACSSKCVAVLHFKKFTFPIG